MLRYRLTKLALKQLKKIAKSDHHIASRVKEMILSLSNGSVYGEALQGQPDFFKIRVGKYRIIYTVVGGDIIVALIEKRETVYKTFQHLMKHTGLSG
ncbi:MAG: type II toxin-antitoxin system RelE/ParE family toxin [Pseudomonadota bacterium]